ncbi:zinc ribbon domain-containing protein [Peribacillus sp. JNUCC 23]
MHCNNCGGKVKKDQTFCTSCGTTIVQKEPAVQQRSESRTFNTLFKSKKSKILAIILLILAVSSFAGYKTVQTMNKPVKIVQTFEKAIEAKNSKELADLLNSAQVEMDVKEADAKMLLDYFNENPDLLAETEKSLRKEAQLLENKNILTSKSEGLLTLIESKKKWGIITQYGLSFHPVYIKVSSNQDKTALFINGKEEGELKVSDERTLGPFLPIDHEVKGSYTGQYTTVTDTISIEPIEQEGNKFPVELDLTGESINIYSNYDKAIVYINGESTGKTVTELSRIGPVSLDGSLKIYAEAKVDGKTLKSEEISITDSEEAIELWIDDTEIIEAAARKAEEATEAKALNDIARSDIESVVYAHYLDISNGYLSDAYDLFSTSRKSKVNFEKWAEGLANNLNNDVKGVVVESVSGDQATATFEMVSRDSKASGDTLVQTWGGRWHLVKEFSGWRLSKPEITKLDSRTE